MVPQFVRTGPRFTLFCLIPVPILPTVTTWVILTITQDLLLHVLPTADTGHTEQSCSDFIRVSLIETTWVGQVSGFQCQLRRTGWHMVRRPGITGKDYFTKETALRTIPKTLLRTVDT